jgi:DNA primase
MAMGEKHFTPTQPSRFFTVSRAARADRSWIWLRRSSAAILRQAAEKLSSWRHSAAADSRTWQPTVTKKINELRPLGFRLQGVDARHPYLRSRGISEATAVEFGIGFYAGPGLMSSRLVIPIHDDAGQLVGYCGRSLDGGQPRYKFPAGFAKSQVLFNLHRAAVDRQPIVIVVEGFFDCLKVHQAGYRSVVALMGSALSERQRRLLVQNFRQIILMLDGDQAGCQARTVISAKLAQDCPVRAVQLGCNVQPDQLSSQSLREILVREGGQLNID